MLASSLAASLRFFLATTSSKLLGVSCTLMGVCLVSSQGKCVAASLFLPDVRVAAKDRRTGQARMMHDGCLQLRIGNGKQGGQAGGRGQSTVKAPPAFSAPPMAMSNHLRLHQTVLYACCVCHQINSHMLPQWYTYMCQVLSSYTPYIAIN